MKYFSKKMILLSLFMLLNYGNNALGYTFYITNFTGQDVKVQLHYAFGKMNKPDDLIRAYETRRLSFKNLNCLTIIKVSTKKSGTWVSKTVLIKIVHDERFKEISEAGVFGDIFVEGFKLWELTGCGNRNFILVTDPDSEKILAITS